MVLVPLVPHVSIPTARLLVMISYLFWGMGFVLFILVLAMLHDRLIRHPLPHAGLAPSTWIALGPVGVGALTLLKLPPVATASLGSADKAVGALSLIGATALWGFGAWWFAVVSLLLLRYLRQGGLPFGMGWWGFTFPLGALTVATLGLARGWKVSPLEDVGAALFVLLVLFWAVVAGRTLWALRTGETRDSIARAPGSHRPIAVAGGKR